MRKTNINKDITRQEVKVGDRIVVSREVLVTAVRETTLHAGVGQPRRPITVVTTPKDSIALTADESVKLLERDEPSFEIPNNALVITWQDDDGYDYIARRNEISDEWVTSSEGPKVTYTTAALIEAIEDEEFDGYTEGSFEVLKRKGFANGGYVNPIGLSDRSLNALRLGMQAAPIARSTILSSLPSTTP